MNVKSVVPFIILSFFYSKASLMSEEHILSIANEHENTLAIDCILNIMKKEIPCSTVVTFVYSNDDVNYLIETIDKSLCYTVIVRSFNDYNWLLKTDAYVILTEDVEDLEEGMALITNDSFWNPRAHIIAHTHDIEYSELRNVFEVLVAYRTYDVIFITNKDNNAEVFTYYPFEEGCCGKSFDDARFISYCDNLSAVEDFFPDKLKDGMRNCTAKVLVIDDTPNIIIKTENNQTTIDGLDMLIIRNVAQHEGLNVEIVEYEIRAPGHAFGVVLSNHTATGLLAALQANKADIAAGGYVLTKNRANVFDYLYGFNFANFNLYTAAQNEPIWKLLYKEFDDYTWLLLIVYFCAIIIIAIIILNLRPRILKSHSDLILKLWGFFFLSNSTGSLLKVRRLRLVLTCWIWFTFLISSFYSTALYSMITGFVKPILYIGPDNLDSLALKPCVSKHIRELFQFAYNHLLPENVPIQNCSFTESSLDTVASRPDLYSIEMSYSYVVREDRYIDDKGNKLLDVWGFSADNILTIFLARGYPLQRRFQSHAIRMYQAGFLQYHKNWFLHKTKTAVSNTPKVFRNVQLTDLTNHYIILAIGTVISTVCLIVEMCVHKRQQHYKYNKNKKLKV